MFVNLFDNKFLFTNRDFNRFRFYKNLTLPFDCCRLFYVYLFFGEYLRIGFKVLKICNCLKNCLFTKICNIHVKFYIHDLYHAIVLTETRQMGTKINIFYIHTVYVEMRIYIIYFVHV